MWVVSVAWMLWIAIAKTKKDAISRALEMAIAQEQREMGDVCMYVYQLGIWCEEREGRTSVFIERDERY